MKEQIGTSSSRELPKRKVRVHWIDKPQKFDLGELTYSVNRTGKSKYTYLLFRAIQLPVVVIHFILMLPMTIVAVLIGLRADKKEKKLISRYSMQRTNKTSGCGAELGAVEDEKMTLADLTKEWILPAYNKILPTTWVLSLISYSERVLSDQGVMDNRRPVLFLRSFFIDEHKTNAPEWRSIPFETQLAAILRTRFGPIIAIGRGELSSQNSRFRRISLGDEEWKTRVAEIARQCVAILMIPDGTPGTLWELDHIMSNRKIFEKTIFINIDIAACDYIDYPDDKFIVSRDSGNAFQESLRRLVGRSIESSVPSQKVVAATLIGDEVNVIAFRNLMDATVWSRGISVAMKFQAQGSGVDSHLSQTMC